MSIRTISTGQLRHMGDQEGLVLQGCGGDHLTVVASICGSDLDPQGLAAQRKILEDAGVIVMDNNGEAARLAAMIIKHRRELLA